MPNPIFSSDLLDGTRNGRDYFTGHIQNEPTMRLLKYSICSI